MKIAFLLVGCFLAGCVHLPPVPPPNPAVPPSICIGDVISYTDSCGTKTAASGDDDTRYSCVVCSGSDPGGCLNTSTLSYCTASGWECSDPRCK